MTGGADSTSQSMTHAGSSQGQEGSVGGGAVVISGGTSSSSGG